MSEWTFYNTNLVLCIFPNKYGNKIHINIIVKIKMKKKKI